MARRPDNLTSALILGGLWVTAGCASSPSAIAQNGPDAWFQAGQARLQAVQEAVAPPTTAKNVILFIGDGMSVPTVTAARILEGQQRGETGEENFLSFEKFPFVALVKTYTTDQQTPDSAGTATAMLTGYKTRSGVISLNEEIDRTDCLSATGRGLTTMIEYAEDAGLATGVVTTTAFTHATPATAYAHSINRDWQTDAWIPIGERAKGCTDIAAQFIAFDHGDGIDVALGGGRAFFRPADSPDPEYMDASGLREDLRDLTAEWRQKYPDGEYVWNLEQFNNVGMPAKLFGLFDLDHLAFERVRADDAGGEPSLSSMTAKAIEMLARDEDGFFLLVESGRIDHAHHGNAAAAALSETIELANAVDVALEMTDLDETLIIVTADHSHTLTFAGYSPRGNPILGLSGASAATLDGKPYTTLSYANGSTASFGEARADLTGVETSAPDYRQQALVPLASETHGGADVAVYAIGPGSQWLNGVIEQNYIFHVMDAVLKVRPRIAE